MTGCMAVLAILAAFAIDLARIHLVKNQMQSAADAGALAAGSKLRHTDSSLASTVFALDSGGSDKIFSEANRVVSANSCAHALAKFKFTLEPNPTNNSVGDFVLGTYGSGFVPGPSVDALKVTVRFNPNHSNGRLPLIFAPLLGRQFVDLEARAIVAIQRPTLLPFVVFVQQWDALLAGDGKDLYSVTDNMVSAGQDGILETTVLPGDWGGVDLPPGNFGWFDLGSESGTDVLRRQIDSGPTQADMTFFGGSIKAGDMVSGQTGIKSGTEVAFLGGEAPEGIYAGILGIPRVIALYDNATGAGTKAQFRVTRFVLARVMDAKLDSNPKSVVIQPITKQDDPQTVRLFE